MTDCLNVLLCLHAAVSCIQYKEVYMAIRTLDLSISSFICVRITHKSATIFWAKMLLPCVIVNLRIHCGHQLQVFSIEYSQTFIYWRRRYLFIFYKACIVHQLFWEQLNCFQIVKVLVSDLQTCVWERLLSFLSAKHQ